MSNRDDWENVADEIAKEARARLVTELHNAFVAGQEQESQAYARILRTIADRLTSRLSAPSLDGYSLADGLNAAADILEGKEGPLVHDDCAPGDDELPPKFPLSDMVWEARAVLSKGGGG